METRSLSIATMTWVRSPDEERLLRRSLTRLSDNGLPVAIADSGTNEAFGAFLRSLPGVRVTEPSAPGLVAQVQASVALAVSFETAYTLYLEPDKELFIDQFMSTFIRRAPADEGVGVVLASRSPIGFETFPPMQRYTEGVINRLCEERLGPRGDYSYGPFLVTRALLPRVAAMDRRLGWGWRHALFAAAAAAGLPIVHVTDDYPCPPDQRTESGEDQRHRMRQLSENILGLLA
jgi:hypothetical protein